MKAMKGDNGSCWITVRSSCTFFKKSRATIMTLMAYGLMLTLLVETIGAVGDLLMPPVCQICKALLDHAEQVICSECQTNLELMPKPHCQRCGQNVTIPSQVCPECQTTSYFCSKIRSPYFFYGTMQQAIHRLKLAGKTKKRK